MVYPTDMENGNSVPQFQGTDTTLFRFLARAIAEKRAIVYVGAGASASAGLADWNHLLQQLGGEGEPFLEKDDREHLKDRLKTAKNLEVGDLLQDILDNDLEQILWDKFGKTARLSDIHLNLARIPFSLAITTNYDRLLEAAFKNPTVLTWKDPEAILRAVQLNRFVLIKTHGAIGNGPSLILGSRNYRDLMHADPRFRQALKWLFMTKTCLFVGASLDDPDLIYLLQETISEYGKSLGPHYALLPEKEAPPRRLEHLFNNFRIRVILVKASDDNLTQAVSRKLRDLSGEVSLQYLNLAFPLRPTSDDPHFYLHSALAELLQLAAEMTGSFRADICLSPDGMGSHLSGELEHFVSYGPTEQRVSAATSQDTNEHNNPTTRKGLKVAPNNICGIAYYMASSDRGIYVTNVAPLSIHDDSQIDFFGAIEYRPCHTDVKSEFAIAIQAEGIRVGVLNLESPLVEAYSSGHQQVARWFADKAGRLYAAAHERDYHSTFLDGPSIEYLYDDLIKLYSDLWSFCPIQLKPSGRLALVVYRVDYKFGTLTAQSPRATIFKGEPKEDIEHPWFKFQSKSLAASIFERQEPIILRDADSCRARDSGIISPKYYEPLKISGGIMGFPIYIKGHIAGVDVFWYRDGVSDLFDGRHAELFRRASHAIANVRIRDYAGDRKATIRLASEIVTIFAEPSAEGVKLKELNQFGRKWAETIGPQVVRLLNILRTHDEIGTKRAVIPIPFRCRVWLRERNRNATDGPRFINAVEVSRDGTCRNLFRVLKDFPEKLFGLATQPSMRRQNPDLGPNDLALEPIHYSHEVLDPNEFGNTDTTFTEKIDALVFRDDTHLSFLLSRLAADRFARVQRPDVLGPDLMADILAKRSGTPWYIAPIVLAARREWLMSEEVTTDQSIMAGKISPVNRRLVGYLTFDGGAEEADSVWNVDEGGRARQNDLLHQLDLFTACLAETVSLLRMDGIDADDTTAT